MTSDVYAARNDMATKTVQPGESAAAKVTADAVNAVIQSAQSGKGGTTANINLNVDGRTVASAVYDPLSGLVRQKGVPVGG